jgi:hypothetical protein
MSLLTSVALLALWPVAPGTGQVPQQTPPTMPGHPQPPDIGAPEPDPMAAQNAAKLEHMREDDRRKRLLADTAKLVALSTELNSEVEKTSKDELSVEVVRKAAEIEKLAHDVKERMKS